MASQGRDKPLRIVIAKDNMKAALCAAEGFEAGQVTDEACAAELRSAELVVDASTAGWIVEFVRQCNAAPGAAREMVVAEGVPPKHGRDGSLSLEARFDPRETGATEEAEQTDENGEPKAIDHYSRSRYRIVKTGDVVGRVIAPTEGVEGRTVQGKAVGARTGKAFEFHSDETIELRADGSIVAARSGALCIEGRSISVLETLHIDGWVDFSTGNISFPGDVTISKGVRDCFVVDADGDVVVHGPVEAASIRAGRDARLLGGMAAREKGSLVIHRDLHARYMGTVAGVIGRDLYVEKECVECDLEVRGAVRAERCVYMGGRLAATSAITLAEVGSDSGTPTEIILGSSPAADRQLGRAGGLRTEVERRLERYEQEAAAFGSRAAHLNPDQRERLRFLRAEIAALTPLRERLASATERLRTMISKLAVAELTVIRVLHTDVRVLLGNYEVQFRKDVAGPVRVFLSATGRPTALDLNTKSTRELNEVATIRHLRAAAQQAARAA